MVHDGNVYFEHCYGADFEPNVSDSDREACWNAWLAHYTRHQPAHRIDYAMRRVEALQAAEPGMSLPGIQNHGISEPVPPSADGNVTLEGPKAGAETANVLETSSADNAEIPHGCAAACTVLEQACEKRCPADTAGCHEGCVTERTTCLGGCY
jgi:hypothetical protein